MVRLTASAVAGTALVSGSLLAGSAATAHETETASGGAATHSRDGAGRQLAALKKSLAAYKDVHVAAVINVLGVLLGTRSFPTTASGYQQMLRWATGFGTLRRAGVECTGSYGAALARHLAGELGLRGFARPAPAFDVVGLEAARV